VTPSTGEPAQDLTFERAMTRLEEIVRQLEAGSLGLSESLVVFREGMQLVARLTAELTAAEKIVQELTEGPGGAIGARPFAPPAEERGDVNDR